MTEWEQVVKALEANGLEVKAGKSLDQAENLFVNASANRVADELIYNNLIHEFTTHPETINTCWIYRREKATETSDNSVARIIDRTGYWLHKLINTEGCGCLMAAIAVAILIAAVHFFG